MTTDLPELPRRGSDPFSVPVTEPREVTEVHPDDRLAQARAFLRWRYPEPLPDAWLTLCEREGAGNPLRVVGAYPVEDDGLSELAQKAVYLSETSDTWVLLNALGGRPPPGKKGGEVGLRYLIGLHEDLDRGIEDPLAFLDGLGEWRPSYVVSSGAGVHAYWLFDQVVDLAAKAEERSPADPVGELHRLRGWYRMLAGRWHAFLEGHAGAAFDDCTNLDRIMRLPGTWNRKRRGVTPVTVARPFEGGRISARQLWTQLGEWGIEARVAGQPVRSAEEEAAAFARQGALGGDETRLVIARLLPVYVHRANTYANSSRSRNRALFDLAQQLNDHGVGREDALEAALEARAQVTEYTEAGEHDPLTVEETVTVVASAYRYPPRGPVGSRESAVAGLVGGNAASGADGTPGGAAGPASPASVAEGSGEVEHRDTDAANGEEIVRLMGHRLMRVDGLGWLVWDGVRWRLDPEDSNRKAPAVRRALVDAFKREAEDAARWTVDERKVWAQRVRRVESTAGLTNAFKAAGPDLLVEYDELDRDPYLLNCPNGTVDLRTGELRAHDPLDRITRCTAVPFVPNATDPGWDKILAHVPDAAENVPFLRRWFGYALTGETLEKSILILQGQKDAGKSTISGALVAALGDYSHVWESDVLEQQHGASGGVASRVAAESRSARLVTASETNKDGRFRESFVKAVTGGDEVSGRLLYQQSISYTPEYKLIMHTNHVPQTRDDALQSRLRIIRFLTLPPEALDRTLIARIKSRDEQLLAASLSWAVQGTREWLDAGQWSGFPARHAIELDAYKLKADHVYAFVRDLYDVLPEGYEVEADSWLTARDVEAHYRAWCLERDVRPLGGRKLYWELRDQHGVVESRRQTGAGRESRALVYVNLRLRRGLVPQDGRYGLRLVQTPETEGEL